MRQAGRSLPEYRAARGSGDILAAVRDPALAAELTLQPVRRHHVDAAILFSDIMVPLAAIGAGIEIVPGKGPVVSDPFRDEKDLSRLRPLEASEDTPFVLEAIRLARAELDGLGVPLIGFAGAPFTVASYLVEGGPSHGHVRTKVLMHSRPDLWHALMSALSEMTIAFLTAQVGAGAQAIQLFDSWAGALSRSDYRRRVLPYSSRVLSSLAALEVPRIHFGVGTGELLADMARAGAEVVGVDWRVSLADARFRCGEAVALQGNLDPVLCLAPAPVVEAEVRRVLQDAGNAAGHIFNLGHGVLPETDPGVLSHIVDCVHQWTGTC